ncbi:MAG: hypothetical protein ACM3YE_13515 [Bacteroidota bacterium]
MGTIYQVTGYQSRLVMLPLKPFKFTPAGQPPLQFVLAGHPELPGSPIVNFPTHSATMKFEANLSGVIPWANSGALWRISRC